MGWNIIRALSNSITQNAKVPHANDYVTGTQQGTKRGVDVANLTNSLDQIAIGNVPSARSITSFGYRTGLAVAAGDQTLWFTSGNFTPMNSAETFTIVFNESFEGPGQQGARSVYIDYIDAAGAPANTIVTLDDTGSQVTSFSGLGINKAYVVDTGSHQRNVVSISIEATTSGTVQAIIPANEGVTQQCIYHTPAGAKAVVKHIAINVNQLTSSSPLVVFKGLVYNRTYGTFYEVFRTTIDTDVENNVEIKDPVGFVVNASEVLYFTGDTDTASALAGLRFTVNEYILT